MHSLAQRLPTLPGLAGRKTYAAWPVWSGSTTKDIRFQPVPKKAATRLWHRARSRNRPLVLKMKADTTSSDVTSACDYFLHVSRTYLILRRDARPPIAEGAAGLGDRAVPRPAGSQGVADDRHQAATRLQPRELLHASRRDRPPAT